jgi:hypothetical protein
LSVGLLTVAAHLSSFNELPPAYQIFFQQQRELMHMFIHQRCWRWDAADSNLPLKMRFFL